MNDILNLGVFTDYVEDAVMIKGVVQKNDKDVGITDRLVNYFYTRHENKPIQVSKSKPQLTSCNGFDMVYPMVFVAQFCGYEYKSVLSSIVSNFPYDMKQIETRKEIILKSERGKITPFPNELIMIYFEKRELIKDCEPIKCEC